MRVAGVDEAGRGPLAGPVVAAAVILPRRYENGDIKDSKKLSAAAREELEPEIKRVAIAWAVAAVGHRRIDRLNIREATKLAMSIAARKVPADLLLIDGNMEIFTSVEQRTVVDGDATHLPISAASILAKVARDRLMRTLSGKYPGYGFEQHFGYGTPTHRAALAALGPCRIHRCTFAGVRELVTPQLPLFAQAG